MAAGSAHRQLPNKNAVNTMPHWTRRYPFASEENVDQTTSRTVGPNSAHPVISNSSISVRGYGSTGENLGTGSSKRRSRYQLAEHRH